MKEVSELSPNERKRLYDSLRQDRGYLKYRNLLLLVSAGSAIGLSLVSWMMMRGLLSEDIMFVAMGVSMMVYLYTVTRFIRARKNVLARLMAGNVAHSDAKVKKKELKKQAQAANKFGR